MYIHYRSVMFCKLYAQTAPQVIENIANVQKNLHFEIIIRYKNVSLHKINAVGLRQD